MPSFSPGFKARMVRRLSGPEAISATALSREVGVSQNSLSRWLRQASVAAPTVAPMSKKKPSTAPTSRPGRTAEEKLQVVLKASGLSQEELGAFLRREGLHEAQLEDWRAKALDAATGALKGLHGKRAEQTPQARRIQELERELRRKDKALAEVTALLALKKKLAEIWGDEDETTPTGSGT